MSQKGDWWLVNSKYRGTMGDTAVENGATGAEERILHGASWDVSELAFIIGIPQKITEMQSDVLNFIDWQFRRWFSPEFTSMIYCLHCLSLLMHNKIPMDDMTSQCVIVHIPCLYEMCEQDNDPKHNLIPPSQPHLVFMLLTFSTTYPTPCKSRDSSVGIALG